MKKTNKTLAIIAVILAIMLIAVVLLILNSLGIIAFGKQSPKPAKMTVPETGETVTYNYDYDNKTLYIEGNGSAVYYFYLPYIVSGEPEETNAMLFADNAPWYAFNKDIQKQKITKVVVISRGDYPETQTYTFQVNGKKQVVKCMIRGDGIEWDHELKYDSKGRLIEMDNTAYEAGSGPTYLRYNDKQLYEVENDEDFQRVSKVTTDKEGRVISAVTDNRGEGYGITTNQHTYNSKGQLIQASETNSDNGNTTRVNLIYDGNKLVKFAGEDSTITIEY